MRRDLQEGRGEGREEEVVEPRAGRRPLQQQVGGRRVVQDGLGPEWWSKLDARPCLCKRHARGGGVSLPWIAIESCGMKRIQTHTPT